MVESEIQTQIRITLGRRADVVLWRNNVGVAIQGRFRTAYGLAPGSSDLIGIVVPSGRFVALEVKTHAGKTTKEQDLFINLVRACGGFAAIVRSVEEANQAIDRAIEGANQ